MTKLNTIVKKRSGYYYIDEVEYPSVTKIIGETLAKGFGLDYWIKKEIVTLALKMSAKAGSENLDFKEVLAEFTKFQKTITGRGKEVHALAEAWCLSNILPTPSGEFEGYTRALNSWIKTHKPKPIQSEILLYSEKHKYAGRCDLICEINGEKWIVDFKTNSQGRAYPETGIQLVSYFNAVHEMKIEKLDKMGVVVLAPDGTFAFKEMNEDFQTFLNVKALWEWRQKGGE